MNDAIGLILMLSVFIPSIIYLVRYRDVPSGRRLSAFLGISGALLTPYATVFLCELLSSVLTVAFLFFLLFGGLGLVFRSIFRWR